MTADFLENILKLPLEEKLKRLALLDPRAVQAIDILVDEAIRDRWQKKFQSGPRGGLQPEKVWACDAQQVTKNYAPKKGSA